MSLVDDCQISNFTHVHICIPPLPPYLDAFLFSYCSLPVSRVPCVCVLLPHTFLQPTNNFLAAHQARLVHLAYFHVLVYYRSSHYRSIGFHAVSTCLLGYVNTIPLCIYLSIFSLLTRILSLWLCGSAYHSH